ncbi:hypothetical protein I6E74_09940 [Salinibacterium sp. SWN139]|uniref:hypothetical protein n=1 Tax=Salinibacterium sp. SWN139 TaxID=2792055 RepID=UPI0018CD0138|nr:hypothetical protein [Salinibacterium sp. SWN139]MBH0054485.1 hypothetical protein [Salinibacterium sp. SWN139]
MTKGIEIGIGSETKAFKQGVESGVIEPIEDAIDALDDLGKNKGTDKLEDGFEAAQKASKELKQEVSETADNIERDFKKSYADMKNSSESGTTKAKADLKELGNEAKMNAAETFSSFDGSAESFADGIQGTLGGIVSSLGPVGAAAGAAGALGIGLIMSKMDEAREGSEEFQERVSDLTDDMLDFGTVGKRSSEAVADSFNDLATSTEDGADNLKEMQKIAERLSSPLDDVTKAYLEGGGALDDLIRKTEDLQEKEQERFEESVAQGGSAYDGLVSGGIKYENQLKGQLDLLKEQRAAIEAAQDAELLALSAGATEYEVKVGLIKSIDSAYDDAAGAVTDFINEESGLFDVAAYIAAMEAKSEALKNYQDDLANSGLSDDAKKFLNEEGAEAAATMVQGYKDASPAQQAQLSAIWSEAGRDNSGEYVKTGQQGFDGAKLNAPEIIMKDPDVNGTVNSIQNKLNQRSVTVKVKTVDQYGRELF